MVRCYIFGIGTILIGLRTEQFFWFYDVGSTYLTVVECCGQLVELSVVISSTQPFLFRSCSFFLRESQYCCLAICPVIGLSSFYLVTEVIGVRLERNFLCSRF